VKNRRWFDECSQAFEKGVNLRNNYFNHFDDNAQGSSPYRCSPLYRGLYKEREKEVQGVIDLLKYHYTANPLEMVVTIDK